MEKRRATSWTGSESGRREQGLCLPPQKPPVQIARFTVPADCPCEIQKVAGGSWRPHRTTIETGYERFETYRDRHYTFRCQGWLMRIHRRYVMHREDTYHPPELSGSERTGRAP